MTFYINGCHPKMGKKRKRQYDSTRGYISQLCAKFHRVRYTYFAKKSEQKHDHKCYRQTDRNRDKDCFGHSG